MTDITNTPARKQQETFYLTGSTKLKRAQNKK